MFEALGISLPIIQVPMAGVSTPALAAAVSDAGGLGSIGVGATDVAGARSMIGELRERTSKPFNVNLFVHQTPKAVPETDRAWLELLRPMFEEYGASPPSELRTIYKSFAEDADMLAMLVEAKPKVVSFHFGVPPLEVVRALKQTGAVLMASATSVAEARDLYEADLALIRPDQIVAWRGHAEGLDIDAVLRTVTGHEVAAQKATAAELTA